MKYNIATGVERSKHHIRKLTIGVAGTLVMAGVAAFPALAAGSPPGYYGNPGREQAIEVGAQCGSGAGSGAFGAFGTYGEGPHDYRGGANGPATGDANSGVCNP
jgi:hypothetical protein